MSAAMAKKRRCLLPLHDDAAEAEGNRSERGEAAEEDVGKSRRPHANGDFLAQSTRRAEELGCVRRLALPRLVQWWGMHSRPGFPRLPRPQRGALHVQAVLHTKADVHALCSAPAAC